MRRRDICSIKESEPLPSVELTAKEIMEAGDLNNVMVYGIRIVPPAKDHNRKQWRQFLTQIEQAKRNYIKKLEE